MWKQVTTCMLVVPEKGWGEAGSEKSRERAFQIQEMASVQNSKAVQGYGYSEDRKKRPSYCVQSMALEATVTREELREEVHESPWAL